MYSYPLILRNEWNEWVSFMERNKHEMNEISFYDYMKECEVNGYHEKINYYSYLSYTVNHEMYGLLQFYLKWLLWNNQWLVFTWNSIYSLIVHEIRPYNYFNTMKER